MLGKSINCYGIVAYQHFEIPIQLFPPQNQWETILILIIFSIMSPILCFGSPKNVGKWKGLCRLQIVHVVFSNLKRLGFFNKNKEKCIEAELSD